MTDEQLAVYNAERRKRARQRSVECDRRYRDRQRTIDLEGYLARTLRNKMEWILR